MYHRTIWHQLRVRSWTASKCSESVMFCTLYIESLCADLLRTEQPIPISSTFLQPKPACAGVRGHGCLLQRGEPHSWPAAEECRDNGQKITQSQRQPLTFIIWYNWAVIMLIWAPILLELLWLYWFIEDYNFSGQRIRLALLLGLLYCDNCPQGGESRLRLRLAICLALSVIPHLFFYRLCHTTVIPRSSRPTPEPFKDNCNAAYFMPDPSWMPKLLRETRNTPQCPFTLAWHDNFTLDSADWNDRQGKRQ